MNTTSETPLLNGMNNVPISSNNINLSNGRPLLTNTTDPVQPQFKRAGIVGRIKNMFKALPHEERRFEKLKEAIYDNNIDEIKRLLATGVNVNNPIDGYGYYGYEGYTLLHFAAERNKYFVVELLLAAGANPDVRNDLRYSPLDLLFKNYNIPLDSAFDVIRLLINAGAYITLHRAVLQNDPKLVLFLIEKGENVNETDLGGRTPLHYATGSTLTIPLARRTDIVRILLDAGANPNIADVEGVTPLHVNVNHIDIVKLLLDAGANTEVKDIQGKTPLDYLKDGHNPELRALLEKTKGGSRKSRKSKKNKKRKTRRS